jgi:polysaccharide export outer membrane protein
VSKSISRKARSLALMVIVGAIAACTAPRPGPNMNEIFAGSVLREGDAYIIAINDRVNRAASLVPALGFSDALRNASLIGTDTIRPGDVVTLSVYENVTEGLLASPTETSAVLEELQVDDAGFIFVPYAGRIQAAGNTPNRLREIITAQLDEQTPDPQVIVRRIAGDGSTVSVIGGVGAQGNYPLQRSNRTLTGMLAAAGGLTTPVETTQVRVTRGARQDSIWLQDLYRHPELDIALRGGDRILVETDERAFTILGATGTTSRLVFDRQAISAIEAIAQVGGLDPLRADPTGVFVFRNEPAAIANAVLGRNDLFGDQRFVYVLNLTAPNGMFMARDFTIRDGDTIYVTEASSVQWSRTIASLTSGLAAATAVNDFTTTTVTTP